ncbi:MAG: hypothetical protein KDD02_07780 [Phaeodactylibacter sp.]|nr:hypothetical protein [Phaeodactylibacter sp.]MCB9302654.1 hypothetical protein [Lewinellaceae bacterium]
MTTTFLIILTLILWAISGAANGVTDTLQFHYSTSIFRKLNPLFWDPKLSWRNKYRDGDPEKGARFPGSTTWLVWTTDALHLFDTISRKAAQLSACFLITAAAGWPLWAVLPALVGVKVAANVGFHIVYSRLEKRM